MFINEINKQLKPIDKNEPWGREVLKIEDKRRSLYSILLKSLMDEYCEIGRVRLWYLDRSKPGEEKFVCMYSNSRTESGEYLENEYIDFPTSVSDIYCKFTLSRFKENPYAMHQHKSMFAEPDLNNDRLGKDPDGKWIVGPIVNRKSEEILGFISADNHIKQNGVPRERKFSERQDAFQRYAVDLIADLLLPVLRFHELGVAEQKKDPERIFNAKDDNLV